MSAQDIARALGGASRGTNGWWQAKCPAHDDGKASLGLKDTDDGGVAYKCLAGCGKAAVGDALKAKGLLHAPAERKAKPKRRIVATYDYVDAMGERVLQVVRYEPKDFGQRRPDPDKPGKWIWNVVGIRRPLYRLPELLAADPAADVFLVEGEKDVDRLRSLGLVATTTAQGADAWSLSDHAPLAGRHVITVPDNDTSGRTYARTAARDLAGKAASVRLLAPPGLPPKGDVSDWLDAGGTADELRRLAAEAPMHEPSAAEERPDAGEDEDGFERWNEKLHRTDRGEARDIIHNVALILRTDGRFKGRLRWNQMLEAVEAQGLPWRGGGWREWTDADDIYLAEWCQKRHAYLRPTTCAAAVQIVARDLAHHPVRERLNAFAWDGTPRLDTWMSTHLGAAESAYNRAVGRKSLISAVARVFEPGCKADHVPILEGPQGGGKSRAIALLAMEDSWFADEIADLGSKDAGQDLRGKWIIELGELAALNRGAIERVKGFISRRIDHYRPSYGRRSQDFPRQCIFIGLTNADTYLADETGNRRFWPVKVGAIDLEGLKGDREQLWAEALVAYRAGESWWLDKAAELEAREVQADRRVVDPWEHAIVAWATAQPGGVTVQEALENAVHMPLDRRDQMAANRVGRIFRASGWDRRQDRVNGTRVWRYHRPKEVREPTDDEVDAERRATAFRRAGASPVSPVSAGHTGDGKASTCAAVPSVTSVTSRGQAHAGAPSTGPRTGVAGVGGWGERNFALRKTSGDTGDTGDRRPTWRALDHWQQRLGAAGMCREKRVSAVLDWGRAAGGEVDVTDEQVRLSLPPDLEDGYPLRELRRLARDLGLMPKVVFTGIDVNDAVLQRQGLAP